MGGAADGFILEVGLGEEVADLDGDVGDILPEIVGECTPGRQCVTQAVDGILFAQMDEIGYCDLAAVDAYVAVNLGVVVADIFEVRLDVVDGGLDSAGTVDNRRRADGAAYPGEDTIVVGRGPVVNAQQRIPAEKRGVGLLLDVLVEPCGIEFLGVGDLDAVLVEAVLPFGQHAGSAAGYCEHQDGRNGRKLSVESYFHLFANHANLTIFS